MARTSIIIPIVLVSGLAAARDLKPAAQQRLDAGLAAYGAGQYERAIGEFEAAYALDADPQLLYAWAQAERLAGRCKSAVPRYQRYLDSDPSEEGGTLARNGISLCEQQGGAGCSADKPEHQPPLPWYKNPVSGTVVTGVVGLGVGIGFLIAASGTRDRALLAQFSDEHASLLDTATAQRRIGITVTVLAATLVGGGIGYHLYTRRQRRTSAVVSSDGRSMFVAGTF